MAVCCLLKICCVLEEFNVKWFCQWNLAPPWAVLPVCSEIQRWIIPGKQSLLHCLARGIYPSCSSSSHLSPAAVISRRGLIASGLRCRIALEINIFLFLVYFFYLPVFLYALGSRERMNRYISIFTWYVVVRKLNYHVYTISKKGFHMFFFSQSPKTKLLFWPSSTWVISLLF